MTILQLPRRLFNLWQTTFKPYSRQFWDSNTFLKAVGKTKVIIGVTITSATSQMLAGMAISLLMILVESGSGLPTPKNVIFAPGRSLLL